MQKDLGLKCYFNNVNCVRPVSAKGYHQVIIIISQMSMRITYSEYYIFRFRRYFFVDFFLRLILK